MRSKKSEEAQYYQYYRIILEIVHWEHIFSTHPSQHKASRSDCRVIIESLFYYLSLYIFICRRLKGSVLHGHTCYRRGTDHPTIQTAPPIHRMESFHSIASRRIQEETIPEDEQVDTVRQHSRVAGGTPRASVFSQSYTETSQGLMAPNEHYNSLRQGINEQGDYECRTGDGLCIRLNPLDGSVSIYCVPDQHYAEIHPNCYAPAAMENVHLLHGGGSGTAVFFGEDPVLGPMVMKHAGPKDTREIFSLATISQELLKRNELDPHAVSAMRQRIPGFLMLYLSPYHLRDRGKELWSSLRGSFWKNKKSFLDNAKGETEVYKLSRESVMRLPVHFLAGDGIHGMRRIRVHRADEDTDTQITVCLTTVILEVPGDLLRDDCVIPDGLRFLEELADELIACQEEENWKVTLAQTTIGGSTPSMGPTY